MMWGGDTIQFMNSVVSVVLYIRIHSEHDNPRYETIHRKFTYGRSGEEINIYSYYNKKAR
jgi:hypothetical protein